MTGFAWSGSSPPGAWAGQVRAGVVKIGDGRGQSLRDQRVADAPVHSLDAQPDGEQPFDDRFVQVAGDPLAVLQDGRFPFGRVDTPLGLNAVGQVPAIEIIQPDGLLASSIASPVVGGGRCPVRRRLRWSGGAIVRSYRSRPSRAVTSRVPHPDDLRVGR